MPTAPSACPCSTPPRARAALLRRARTRHLSPDSAVTALPAETSSRLPEKTSTRYSCCGSHYAINCYWQQKPMDQFICRSCHQTYQVSHDAVIHDATVSGPQGFGFKRGRRRQSLLRPRLSPQPSPALTRALLPTKPANEAQRSRSPTQRSRSPTQHNLSHGQYCPVGQLRCTSRHPKESHWL